MILPFRLFRDQSRVDTGHSIATNGYGGEVNSLDNHQSLAVDVFDFAARDETTGNSLFLSANGAYIFMHGEGDSSVVLKGNGMASPSPCSLFLEHIADDHVLIAEVNTCNHTAAATAVYKGVTYSLTDNNTIKNPDMSWQKDPAA